MSLSAKAFTVRLMAWLVFLAPVEYVAYIASVAVHEILGHGITAWALGGTFSGFHIFLDGMGWAYAWSEHYPNIVLAAGSVASIASGLALTAVALRVSHPLARAAVLLFAICMLEDGFSYPFWNCCFVRPPGDFGRILLNLDHETLRWVLLVIFGAGYLSSTLFLNILLFRCLESDLGPLGLGRASLIAWLFFGVGGAAVWFGFDWNQVIEDIGRLPQFVGAGLQLAMAPVLVATRRQTVTTVRISRNSRRVYIATAWLACVGLLLALTLWFRHGVEW